MPFLSGGFVDRIARRPSGLLGYLFYRFPLGHKPGFDLALDRLPPTPRDVVLEVGCGGGVFMRRLLASGCTAIAVDHSADMVRNASRLNAEAIRARRLAVSQADAGDLPVETCSIDKVYCLNAFFFFPDPQKSLAEMARVLKPGGKLALITSPPEFREKIVRFSRKMAESMRFDEPSTLEQWARDAGFSTLETRRAANAGFLMIATRQEKA
ncbi:class I SAM-dependent methyltransferase [Metarhizobium album]|uniref:Class I SAM-dependent methyltransferase n=1 Tax=Metarhizobium album TaxID=2182425 RepID=A0A2U2DIN5_9HYPH|nr:class I SAM-dependent methyltransferase [Rhizobium album]PWE53165.1 class I SAM-dependent methyltransferase [Rhizobium album]